LGERARGCEPAYNPPPNPLPQPLKLFIGPGKSEPFGSAFPGPHKGLGGGSGGRAGTCGPWPSPQYAIINPKKGKREAPVPERVVLTFNRPDYNCVCGLLQAPGPPRDLWDCNVQEGTWEGRAVAVAGPALGAPYAVLVMEKLIALGARVVLALGWCGSLAPVVKIAHLVAPDGALSTEGTSPHYPLPPGPAGPHAALFRLILARLPGAGVPWHVGPVWTTDAPYRETVEQVKHFQAQGALGVDMEMSALFNVGRFRGIPVAGLLVVSDELFDLTWRPGYRLDSFKQARDQAARLVLQAAAAWEAPDD